MKKIGIGFAGMLFAFSAILPVAFAQTSASDLMATIKSLQAQLDTLRTAQQQVQTASQNIQSTIMSLRNLRQGMSGDDVKALQKLLASDPTIYPEGLTSGYYGALTAKAVKAFQKKHGLEQVGEVGPKTRDLLQKLGLMWFSTTTIATSTGTSTGGVVWGDDDNDRGQSGERQIVICQVPPGNSSNRHTISVGLSAVSAHLKKGSFIGPCAGTTGTSTPSDVTAPVISAVTVTGTTSSSTTIAWLTNEAASTQVWFSTTTPVASGSATVSVPGLVTNHSVSLSGLTTATTYFVLLSSSDASGNTSTSTVSFMTQ